MADMDTHQNKKVKKQLIRWCDKYLGKLVLAKAGWKAVKKIFFVIWKTNTAVYLKMLSITGHDISPQPDSAASDGKEIYLTFDDGPGPYTKELLKILNLYNIKATFFVTGNGDANIISEIAGAGHSIGNHTYSHKYKTIYENESAFCADFDRMEALIAQKAGLRTKLMRFPGGSSNTVSRFNPRIMTRLSDLVQKNGYQYFDWNVDSDDAGTARLPGTVYKNVISGIKKNNVSVVLLHDVKDYSVIAIKRIIIWGLKHGYTFLPLNENSPAAHHKINN